MKNIDTTRSKKLRNYVLQADYFGHVKGHKGFVKNREGGHDSFKRQVTSTEVEKSHLGHESA